MLTLLITIVYYFKVEFAITKIKRYIRTIILLRQALDTGDNYVIDSDGFRPNVGIVLLNTQGQVLWARRIGQPAWQFPQGGIKHQETVKEALFRELKEEVGLLPKDIKVLARTKNWLRYRLPKHLLRHQSKPLCIGQKQKWFLLQMLSSDERVSFNHSDKPEFDRWQWVSYWYPINQVVLFKRDVYRRALSELAPAAHLVS